jgi:hypothetical protein
MLSASPTLVSRFETPRCETLGPAASRLGAEPEFFALVWLLASSGKGC